MEHILYVGAIKKALRSRGITYSDLAKSLKMTESGVKKMLNAKDISFQRILKICKIIDVLPGQIFSISEQSTIHSLYLSDKQQDALIHDRKLLGTYWLLTIDKKSTDEIALQMKASSQEVKVRLQKLVTLELAIQKKNQFFPKHVGKFRWPDDSKLAKILNHELSHQTLKQALNLRLENSGLHRFAALKLSELTFVKFLNRFSDLFNEMAQVSEREELTLNSKELFDFTFVLASAKGAVFDST